MRFVRGACIAVLIITKNEHRVVLLSGQKRRCKAIRRITMSKNISFMVNMKSGCRSEITTFFGFQLLMSLYKTKPESQITRSLWSGGEGGMVKI